MLQVLIALFRISSVYLWVSNRNHFSPPTTSPIIMSQILSPGAQVVILTRPSLHLPALSPQVLPSPARSLPLPSGFPLVFPSYSQSKLRVGPVALLLKLRCARAAVGRHCVFLRWLAASGMYQCRQVLIGWTDREGGKVWKAQRKGK